MMLTVTRTASLRYAASTSRSAAANAGVGRTFSTSSSPASLSSIFTWFSGKSSGSPANEPAGPSKPTAGSVSDHVVASTPPPTSAPPTSSTASPLPSSIASLTTSSTPAAAAAASSTPSDTSAKCASPVQGKMLARDQELLSKLLDREGGSAGVSIVNGRYEEGLGPETKKNMFRLI
ncbi:uncharacterized protein SPSC_02652 [Sporisorium scitamineum]|uniref:Uncharacterized protein n=1 Tax=Sporisorium scitamineum TaxID=49012 RepID=A0A127ZEW7_9BASI|nr:uncharacterized protein SPSC_02652 [Sporisorium scitamineum]